jgi:hypothetical protein
MASVAAGQAVMTAILKALGGGTKAAGIAGVRVATIYAWRDAGRVSLLGPAMRLVKAAEPKRAKRLAMLEAITPDD